MELQVPYSFYTKVKEKSVFRRKTIRDKGNTSKIMPMERGRNNRGRSMSRPYTYYVDTVGKNTKAIKEYIADQLKQDKESDQIAMFDPRDPFMGSK